MEQRRELKNVVDPRPAQDLEPLAVERKLQQGERLVPAKGRLRRRGPARAAKEGRGKITRLRSLRTH